MQERLELMEILPTKDNNGNRDYLTQITLTGIEFKVVVLDGAEIQAAGNYYTITITHLPQR